MKGNEQLTTAVCLAGLLVTVGDWWQGDGLHSGRNLVWLRVLAGQQHTDGVRGGEQCSVLGE